MNIFFDNISSNLRRNLSENVVAKNFKILPTGQNHLKLWCLGFTKLRFLQKLSRLVHYNYSSSKALFFWRYPPKFLKLFIKK